MPADLRAREAPFAVLCLSGFGLGLAPFMPGTVASLAVAVLLWLVPTSATAFVALAVAGLVFGCWATLQFGHTVSGKDDHGDPGWVVSDEVAGQALACLGALPATGDWIAIAVAFVSFRILDILKPGPIGWMEKKPGGFGVLMDDVVAGGFAALVTLGVALALL